MKEMFIFSNQRLMVIYILEVKCPSIAIQNSTAYNVTGQFSDNIRVKCKYGHDVNGSGVTSFQLECTADGSWAGIKTCQGDN